MRIARVLGDAGFATMLFDLETAWEMQHDPGGLDLAEATSRTRTVVHWLRDRLGDDLPIGLIGSSTGAAVALETAVDRSTDIAAVVSRGGRVDLVPAVTTSLDVPVLLIVGGADTAVLEWNREFATRLRAPHELSIVEGATHLFDEPGALDEATALAVDWFERWLMRAGAPVPSRPR